MAGKISIRNKEVMFEASAKLLLVIGILTLTKAASSRGLNGKFFTSDLIPFKLKELRYTIITH